MNDFIIVPVTTLQGRELGAGERKIGNIALRLVDRPTADTALPALRRILCGGTRGGLSGVRPLRADEGNGPASPGLRPHLQAVGLISLIVGGIVVANILMASFRERVCEIGVRKPWAPRMAHRRPVPVESVVVSGIGGTLGLASASVSCTSSRGFSISTPCSRPG